MNSIWYLVLSENLLLIAFGLLNFKSWLDHFKPDWFYIFNLYENNMLNFDEYKIFLPLAKKKDKYEIDKCEYDKSGFQPYINTKGVYTWSFIRGYVKPIQFIEDNANLNGKLVADVKKQALDDIWMKEQGFGDFLKNYGVLIVAGLIVVLFFYLINQNSQTTNLLLNLTRK